MRILFLRGKGLTCGATVAQKGMRERIPEPFFFQITAIFLFGWGGVRSDPPLPNKKPVFYLGEGGWPVEPTQIGRGSNAPSTLQPPSPK